MLLLRTTPIKERKAKNKKKSLAGFYTPLSKSFQAPEGLQEGTVSEFTSERNVKI